MKLPHIIGLDLMRAAAILLVLVFHWIGHFGLWVGIAIPPALDIIGDTGVALFFALSGFLIGGILIRIGARRPGWQDFRAFILRRAWRTLPLYFLWLGLLLVIFPPRQDALAVGLRLATLTQNLLEPMPADYYFAVSWSLAIEEWFYLLFGAAYIVIAHWRGGVWASRICLPAFLILPLLARVLHGNPPSLVPFRLDELVYGVGMAQLFHNRSQLLHQAKACLLAGMILISVATMLPAPLISNTLVAGCALCLPAALRIRHAAPWLALPARWIASRSYALYLIHLTILVDVVESGLWQTAILPMPACIALAILLPGLLAELSYRCLEQPILRMQPAQRRNDRYRPPVGVAPKSAT